MLSVLPAVTTNMPSLHGAEYFASSFIRNLAGYESLIRLVLNRLAAMFIALQALHPSPSDGEATLPVPQPVNAWNEDSRAELSYPRCNIPSHCRIQPDVRRLCELLTEQSGRSTSKRPQILRRHIETFPSLAPTATFEALSPPAPIVPRKPTRLHPAHSHFIPSSSPLLLSRLFRLDERRVNSSAPSLLGDYTIGFS